MNFFGKFPVIVLLILITIYANSTNLFGTQAINSTPAEQKKRIIQLYVDGEITKQEAIGLLKELKSTATSDSSLKSPASEKTSDNAFITEKLRKSRKKLEVVSEEILALENQLNNNKFHINSSENLDTKPITTPEVFPNQKLEKDNGPIGRGTLLEKSYYLFGYMRDTEEYFDYERNSIKVAFQRKLHKNFSLNYDFFLGKSNWSDKYWYTNNPNEIFTEEKTATEFGFSFGATYNLPINLKNEVLSIISPFASAKMGYVYTVGDQMEGIPGTSIRYTPVGNTWPWHLTLGTELLLFDSFSLIPHLDYSSAFASDLESSTMFGIDIVYFLSSSFGLKASYMTGSDKGKIDLQFIVHY